MKDFEEIRTVQLRKGRVILIDQTKLPQRLSLIQCSSVEQVASAIRSLVVRGAPAIGVAAAMGLALTAQKSRAKNRGKLLQELKRSADLLRKTRPTAVNLPWALERVLERAVAARRGVDSVKRAVVAEVVKMADEDVKTNRRMGKLGAGLIEDGDVVMTHCNRSFEIGIGRVREPSPPSATVRP